MNSSLFRIFSRDEHRARLAAALRRRLYPNTGLHPKVLAHAIGVSDDTIANWSNGYSDPSSWKVGLLFVFFGVDFWCDVYGPIGEAMRARFETAREQDLERLQREEARLQELRSE